MIAFLKEAESTKVKHLNPEKDRRNERKMETLQSTVKKTNADTSLTPFTVELSFSKALICEYIQLVYVHIQMTDCLSLLFLK